MTAWRDESAAAADGGLSEGNDDTQEGKGEAGIIKNRVSRAYSMGGGVGGGGVCVCVSVCEMTAKADGSLSG